MRKQKIEDLQEDNYIIFSYKYFTLYRNRESGEHNCLFLHMGVDGKPTYEDAKNKSEIYTPDKIKYDELYKHYENTLDGKVKLNINESFKEDLMVPLNDIYGTMFSNYCEIKLSDEEVLYVYYNKIAGLNFDYSLFIKKGYFQDIFGTSIKDFKNKRAYDSKLLSDSKYRQNQLLLEKDKIKMFRIGSFKINQLHFLFCKEDDNDKIMFFRDIRKEGDSLIISLSCYDEHNRENIVEYKLKAFQNLGEKLTEYKNNEFKDVKTTEQDSKDFLNAVQYLLEINNNRIEIAIAEEKRKKEEEEKKKKEEENKKIEEEKKKQELEAKKKKEEEELARKKLEEAKKKKEEEEAIKKLEEEKAKKEAAELARKKEIEDAQNKAEEDLKKTYNEILLKCEDFIFYKNKNNMQHGCWFLHMNGGKPAYGEAMAEKGEKFLDDQTATATDNEDYSRLFNKYCLINTPKGLEIKLYYTQIYKEIIGYAFTINGKKINISEEFDLNIDEKGTNIKWLNDFYNEFKDYNLVLTNKKNNTSSKYRFGVCEKGVVKFLVCNFGIIERQVLTANKHHAFMIS